MSDGLPDYVSPRDAVPRAGALSAEAIVREYEAAAQELETVGRELVESIRKCESAMDSLHESAKVAIANIKDTAKIYRDAGANVFKQIEECTLLTEKVKQTCDNLKAGLGSVS